jgi:hypothetical protein
LKVSEGDPGTIEGSGDVTVNVTPTGMAAPPLGVIVIVPW